MAKSIGQTIQAVLMTLGQPSSPTIQLPNLTADTRKILLKLQATVADTGGGHVINWVDPFSGLLLAIDTIRFQISGDSAGTNGTQGTNYDMSGQDMAYYMSLMDTFPIHKYGVTGNAGATLTTQTVYIPVDFTALSGRPLDALLARQATCQLYVVPATNFANVASNAGFTISALNLSLVQDNELRPGSNPAYVGLCRVGQQKKAQPVIASTPGQQVTFQTDEGTRVQSLILMIGGAGSSQNSIAPIDLNGITGLGLTINGNPIVPNSTDPYFLKIDDRYERKMGLSQFDVFPTAGASGNTPGLPGCYVWSFNDPADSAQLGQLPTLNSTTQNYFQIDTGTAALYAKVLVLGYKGIVGHGAKGLAIPIVPTAVHKK
jgi:hypothetical protein